MKRILTGILTAALLLSIGTTSALAAGVCHRRNDTNEAGDGICDYAHTACTYADENEDGICDFCSSQTCPGKERLRDQDNNNSGRSRHRSGSGHGCHK